MFAFSEKYALNIFSEKYALNINARSFGGFPGKLLK